MGLILWQEFESKFESSKNETLSVSIGNKISTLFCTKIQKDIDGDDHTES